MAGVNSSEGGVNKQACRVMEQNRDVVQEKCHTNYPFFDAIHITEASKSVCRIFSSDGGSASGFIVRIQVNAQLELKGLLTNNHVISLLDFRTQFSCTLNFEGLGDLQVNLKFRSGKHFFTDEILDATFVEFNQETVDLLGEHRAGWYTLDAVARSEEAIFVIQHPAHQANGRMKHANGRITSVTGSKIRHMVNTEGGSSGSPLVNCNGVVVGLHCGSHENENYATNAKSILTAILANYGDLFRGGQLLRPLPGFVTSTSEPDMTTADNRGYSRARMSCGHVIGTVYLKMYCEEILSRKLFKIKCPHTNEHGAEDCPLEWEWYIVRHLLSPLYQKECEEIDMKLSENYLLSKPTTFKKCPGCQVWCIRVHTHIKSVRCLWCTKTKQKVFEFCWGCRGVWNRSTDSCGDSNCRN